jgi:hypothetical protein
MPEFLVGARAIAKKLERLGLLPKDDPNNEDRVYYLARSGKLAIDHFGNQLISTDAKLERLVDKLVS